MAAPLLLPAIASMVGSVVNAGAALWSTKRTNEAQQRESELAWRRQQESIREQNSYNSASAQMSRLMAAGLNPNLMYDNGQQASAGMQDSHAEYQPAPIQNAFAPAGPVGSDVISSMIGLKDLQNKTASTEADIALKSVQGLNEVSKAGLNDASAKLILQQWGFNEQMNPLLITEKNAEIYYKRVHSAKTLSDIRVNSALVRKFSSDTGLNLANAERILGLWMSEKAEIEAHIKNYGFQNEFLKAQVHNLDYQNLNLSGQAQLAFTNSEYLRGMLKVNFLRYYLDESLGFQKVGIEKDKVKVMREYLDFQKDKFKKELNFQKYQFEIGTMRGFSQDMVNVGNGLVNLLATGAIKSPMPAIGF